MDSVWFRLALLAAAAFILAGCATNDPLKAPKHPEQFTVPPADDARFSQPPAYPKDVLNQDRTPVSTDGPNKGKAGMKAGGPGGGSPGGY